MKYTRIYLFAVIALLTGLMMESCSDIMVADITGSKVTVLSPSDSSTITQSFVLFRWEPSDDVDEYRLQIASPDFNNPQIFIDTTVSGESFQVNLTTNRSYQWTIRGQNSAFETMIDTLQFTVAEDSSLTGQAVVLELPTDNAILGGSDTPILSWYPLAGASQYHIQIASTAGFGSILEEQTALTGASYTPGSLTNDGIYYWRVRGLGNGETSDWSTAFRFSLDYTPPQAPVCALPIENDSISVSELPFTFVWISNGSDVASEELAFSTDTTGAGVSFTVTPSTGQHQYSFTTVNYNALGAGARWWRVTAIDIAGNTARSQWRKFILN